MKYPRYPSTRLFNRSPRAMLAKGIWLLCLIVVSLIARPYINSHRAQDDKGISIQSVVDGDTLVLSGGERVRLIGIDTPELHMSNKLLADARRGAQDISTIQALGKRAKSFTENLCRGKKVSLEFDVDKKDKYGRTLAYVYLEDGTFVNAEIVKEGYAQIMTIPPNVRYARLLQALEQEARKDKRGLWR